MWLSDLSFALKSERLQEELQRARDRVGQLHRNRQACATQVDVATSHLQATTQAAGPFQQAALFDATAPDLLSVVRRNCHMFTHAPIGPIGAHVTLSDVRQVPSE
jgi:aromatic ring hydroxylase